MKEGLPANRGLFYRCLMHWLSGSRTIFFSVLKSEFMGGA